MQVRLRGLQSRPELNGRLGTVLGPAVSSGRVPVLVGVEQLLLKPLNCVQLAAGGTAPSEVPSAAGGRAADTGAGAAASAAAAGCGAEEEEHEYLFVSLEGVPESLYGAEDIFLEGLLTETPRVTVGDTQYSATFDDDVGSTLFFDRAALKRVADAQDRSLSELRVLPVDERPLTCVTSKRLRLSV
jgi:hypothetical protein